MVGVLQTTLGILRVGFIVNFLSHPVLSAFTSAAAVLIGFSQIKHVIGVKVPRFDHFYELVGYTVTHLGETNRATLMIGLFGVGVLVLFKTKMAGWLQQIGLPEGWVMPLSKTGPLFIVIGGILLVFIGGLDQTAAVSIVGAVPAGLPSFTSPLFDWAVLQQLWPAAVAISLVGYMESVSVAKSLASKRREKIDPNQELVALGLANIGAAFTGGYPVTGGISRSVVNFSAGARTGMASLITAALVAFTALFLTPVFYYLPQAILAAIILVAVFNMVDIKTFVDVWCYNRGDGIAWLVTFGAVLLVGVESGILYGAVAALGMFIWRTSRPHIAVVGRLGDSEIYRNVLRHSVTTWPDVIGMRIDQSLYFANTRALETAVLGLVADRPDVKHFVLIGTAINFIDASAVETLEELRLRLGDAGVALHLAAIKGPILDQLRGSHFYANLGEASIHFSTHEAMKALGKIK